MLSCSHKVRQSPCIVLEQNLQSSKDRQLLLPAVVVMNYSIIGGKKVSHLTITHGRTQVKQKMPSGSS